MQLPCWRPTLAAFAPSQRSRQQIVRWASPLPLASSRDWHRGKCAAEGLTCLFLLHDLMLCSRAVAKPARVSADPPSLMLPGRQSSLPLQPSRRKRWLRDYSQAAAASVIEHVFPATICGPDQTTPPLIVVGRLSESQSLVLVKRWPSRISVRSALTRHTVHICFFQGLVPRQESWALRVAQGVPCRTTCAAALP
jgi:hypothetical protein